MACLRLNSDELRGYRTVIWIDADAPCSDADIVATPPAIARTWPFATVATLAFDELQVAVAVTFRPEASVAVSCVVSPTDSVVEPVMLSGPICGVGPRGGAQPASVRIRKASSCRRPMCKTSP